MEGKIGISTRQIAYKCQTDILLFNVVLQYIVQVKLHTTVNLTSSCRKNKK